MPIQPGFELTKKAILERLTQEEIFEKYLGLEVDDGVFYCNPLRPDKRASCRYYYNAKGVLYFHDWGKYHWDCFAIVQYKFGGLSFTDAIRKIAKDFNLLNSDVNFQQQYVTLRIKERAEVKVAVRHWNDEDLKFWKAGNITVDTLTKFNVHPIKAFWINKEYYRCWQSDPTYCYYFGNGLYKLYFPKRTTARFYQNIDQIGDDLTQGWNNLPETGDILFLTKSYKDVMSMSTFGLISDAVLSETHVIKPEKIELYKQRFKKIYTLFDNDQTGRRLAIRYYRNYGIPYLMFPKSWKKDFFDNVRLFGVDKMQEIINIWKNE